MTFGSSSWMPTRNAPADRRPGEGRYNQRVQSLAALPELADRLAPGPNIRYAALDDVVVVMDLRTARYFLLDEVATAMWHAVLTHGATGAVPELTSRFEVNPVRLEADLTAFVDSCRARGFLTTAGVTAPPAARSATRRPIRRLLALHAWWALATTVVCLRVRGFGAAYRRLGAGTGTGARTATPLALARAEAAFLRAENFFVLRAAPNDCLARSLSMFRFLTALGLPATHYIGVRRIPLMMHAWVECGGRVILDRPDCRDMTVVAQLGA